MSSADNPAMDRTLEEHRADQGVKVEKVSRNGHEERQEVLKIYRTETTSYVPLDGTEAVDRERKVVINEMPEANGYETLLGLAELYGYELTPK